MGIAIPADVKEQIFEYANLIGEEEKVRTCIKELHEKWLPLIGENPNKDFLRPKTESIYQNKNILNKLQSQKAL